MPVIEEDAMVPEVHQPPSWGDYLHHHLNLTPEFEAGRLSVERVADVVMLAMAHSDGYAATAHLVSLMGSLPVPSDEPHDFWFELWQSSGSAYWMPGNVRHHVLRALRGDGAGLAHHLISALAEMDSERRAAAAKVIGGVLQEGLFGFPVWQLGQWWLRDVEETSWRVVYADRKRVTLDEQREFEEGWRTS
ncbi:hypothetical protein [Streptomyces sp. NPDC086989]|uniref:hypothetical protein n=1 Tax=Streptomyces sp. NPDC086989 TaxID=3365764 RepID=UPI0038237AC9